MFRPLFPFYLASGLVLACLASPAGAQDPAPVAPAPDAAPPAPVVPAPESAPATEVDAILNTAQACVNSHKWDDAIAQINRALDIAPNRDQILRARAYVQLRKGDLDRARRRERRPGDQSPTGRRDHHPARLPGQGRYGADDARGVQSAPARSE